MPAPRSELHPAIVAAVDEILKRSVQSSPILDESVRQALQKQLSIRSERLWRRAAFPLGFFALLATIVLLAGRSIPFDLSIVSIFLMLMAVPATFAYLKAWNAFRVSDEELAALAPALRLTRVQRVYLDGWLALRIPSAVPDRHELLRSLASLVDEEEKLLALQRRQETASTNQDKLRMERETLQKKLDAATDPVVRESLSHALRLLERRFAEGERTVVLERIDAQLESLGQLASSVRDSLYRLRNVSGETVAALDLEDIRQTIRQVEIQTAALEDATAEIRAIQR